jgi:XisH protein
VAICKKPLDNYQVYRSVLMEIDPGRVLYLAVPQRVYESLFAERFGQCIRQRLQLRLMVFDEHEERIVAWIP